MSGLIIKMLTLVEVFMEKERIITEEPLYACEIELFLLNISCGIYRMKLLPQA